MASKETKRGNDTADVSATPAAMDFTPFVDANGAHLAALVKSGEAVLAGMTVIGQEVMQFATAQLRDNMALSGTVLQCGDPGEAFRLECDYARNATRQYLDQASKLLGLAATMSEKSWAPLEDLTKATLGRSGSR